MRSLSGGASDSLVCGDTMARPDRLTHSRHSWHSWYSYRRYSSECHYTVRITMDKAVSAADANRRFSELLRTVKNGRSVIVTSHGKPVAKITPIVKDERAATGARLALFERLRRERVVKIGRWTRDELYDDA